MNIFAPENLPGVGIGDVASVAGVCGLLGLAVTSGMLVAEGVLGTLLYVAGALAVLAQKRDFGGATVAAVVVLIVLAAAVVARALLLASSRRDAATLAGAAKDAPETTRVAASVARHERMSQGLAIVGVVVAGGAAGFAWSEWNEVPFRLADGEAWTGLVLGVVAALVGGDAAWRFLHGATRAGGSAPIVGAVVCIAAFLLNSVSVYVPFVGAIVVLLALALAIRLRRRRSQKHAGLRILT